MHIQDELRNQVRFNGRTTTLVIDLTDDLSFYQPGSKAFSHAPSSLDGDPGHRLDIVADV